MSGVRARLARLERMKAPALSLKGLSERMRKARYVVGAQPGLPRTREQLEARLSSLASGTVAHKMAERLLRAHSGKGN